LLGPIHATFNLPAMDSKSNKSDLGLQWKSAAKFGCDI